MSLERYINNKHEGNPHWFEDEVKDYWHMERVQDALQNREYLAGNHAIKKRIDEVYNGQIFKTRKIILNYAKTLLSFETAFLLKNPVTLISSDLDALEQYKKVYKEGKYNQVDYKILSNMVMYGEVYEYLYLDDNRRIKSILIDAEDGYPVTDETGEMLAFINYIIYDGISYYTVYTENMVYEYSDLGGDLHKIGEYKNLSGLPIAYRLPSELDELRGSASLNDYIDILDTMEDLLSKNIDAFYKYLSPIPVFKGSKMSTKDGQVNENAVGFALELSEDADFSFANSRMDYQSFKEIWKTLKQSLFDISMTPSVALNSQDVSNLAETSIRMMYAMAEIKGAMNSLHLKEGFEKRWGKMKGLLNMIGKEVKESAYIDCNFNMNIPQNQKEIIDNLVNATGGQPIMSVERAVEVNPYTNDVNIELDRLGKSGIVEGVSKVVDGAIN